MPGTDTDARTLQSLAPATGERLGRVPVAGAEQVDAAVAEARAVQRLWAQLRLADRARYMARAAQAVIDEATGIVALIAREQGRPSAEAELQELLPAIETLQWLAEPGPRILAGERIVVVARATPDEPGPLDATSRSAWSACSARRPSRSPRRWATSRSR